MPWLENRLVIDPLRDVLRKKQHITVGGAIKKKGVLSSELRWQFGWSENTDSYIKCGQIIATSHYEFSPQNVAEEGGIPLFQKI